MRGKAISNTFLSFGVLFIRGLITKQMGKPTREISPFAQCCCERNAPHGLHVRTTPALCSSLTTIDVSMREKCVYGVYTCEIARVARTICAPFAQRENVARLSIF